MGELSVKGEIVLRSRREMSICGVEEVLSFDEEGARLRTVDGELFVDGSEIKIDTLDTDRGIVLLTGKINSIAYASESDKQRRSFFGRLVR